MTFSPEYQIRIRDYGDDPANANELPTCANCKHWDREHDWVKLSEYGGQQKRKEGLCLLTESHGEAGHQQTLARSEDAEGYHSALMTKPEFSCIQWEKR